MIKPTHIFFDLDHTLWDYDTNARYVLADMYGLFKLDRSARTTVGGFIQLFFKTNAQLWHQYNLGQINKDAIRSERFSMIMKSCQGPANLCEELNTYFHYHCPRQKNIMAEADMLLHYLHGRYHLSIITNGFDDVQHIKLESSGLSKFFTHVFTSETIGYRKPDVQIFDHALKLTGAEKHRSFMIGDNPTADIMGATNAGLTPVLYNPEGLMKSDCAIQISRLSELMRLL